MYNLARLELGRIGLRAGVCVPLLYFGTVIVASFFVPGYSHVRQAASDLGMATVPHPAIFNTGAMLVGICTLGASQAVWIALRRLGVRALAAAYVAGALALLGVAQIFAARFPAPDPRHGGFGLAFPIAFAPLVVAGLHRYVGLRAFARYSLIVFLGFVALTPEYLFRHGVIRPYAGLLQRLISLFLFPWVGALALVLLRGFSTAPPNKTLQPTSRVPR